jgi:two-component sensor histidine kinase
LPIQQGDRLVGMLGMANRPAGYDSLLVDRLQPLCAACAQVLIAYRSNCRRQEAEQSIRDALAEKEVLLREIHHRVKNNMQVIHSLLSLQSRQVEDPKAREALQESRDRVRSMSLVHEKLYLATDLARVNFGEYARQLTAHLRQSFGQRAERVEVRVDADDARLAVDSAIPCGLIINELVSNAIKHGYADGRRGEIQVALHRRNGCFHLVVADDGKGVAEGVDLQQTLGMRLVESLVRQLHGEMRRTGPPGTRFEIEFPASVQE